MSRTEGITCPPSNDHTHIHWYPWDLLTTQFQPCHPLRRIIPWLPIALRIEPQFLKQSELCPCFLFHELLPPHMRSMLIFYYFPELAMILCPCTGCSLCLPALPDPSFPMSSSCKLILQVSIHLIISSEQSPWSFLHRPRRRKDCMSSLSPKSPSTSREWVTGTGLTYVYLAHIRSWEIRLNQWIKFIQ